ncbi:MAG: FlxA-like family protein [Lachnospiraceae bacterium]|nr:FlxA-like family protein [Lachnospiraceae bacterium]
MTINSINGANIQMGQMGLNQATDSYSRNIQNQIVDAQKQLQELSSNKDMTQEEKMTKRQEIQQQISDLNMQLRQHQMEMRMQAQQKNGNSFDDMLGGSQKAGTTGSADMGVLISLSTTKEQIAGMKKVRTDLEGKLRTVETDEARESLQKKIDSLTEDICEKVKETQDTISDYQKTEQDKKEDEKENETNVVSEEENGRVEVKSAESANTDVEVQKEKE